MSTEELNAFCPGGKIAEIECKDSETSDDWTSLQEATCTVEDGLQCTNLPFDGVPPCRNYHIRYRCNCSDPLRSAVTNAVQLPINPAPVNIRQIPAAPTCVNRWSSWINRNDPVTTTGDFEKMTPTELASFCPSGRIINIECKEADTLLDFSSLSEATCTVENGLQCTNLPFEGIPPCRDYKVRYQCQQCQAARRRRDVQRSASHPDPTAIVKTVSNIPEKCKKGMGVMKGRVRNEMMSASSYLDHKHSPQIARLGSQGSWLAAVDDKHQYLQIDFLVPVYLSGVTTQGRPDATAFVKSYKIFHSSDGVNWSPYRVKVGVDMIFLANTDSVTPVKNMFIQPLRARYLRINPQSWQGRIALRIEVHGCHQDYPSVSPSTTNHEKVSVTADTTDTVYDCVEWDKWVDTNQPTIRNRNDDEPIEDIIRASPNCQDPVTIECRTATPDHRPAKTTGQKVICNLWDGLICNSSHISEKMCFNYEIRLGCLKETYECLAKVASPAYLQKKNQSKSVLTCYPGMDTRNCPGRCAPGYYCNGVACVLKKDCPCAVEDKIIKPGGITRNSKCDTCQCIGGEVICKPKVCAACKTGSFQLDKKTCSCQCETCSSNEFQCGSGLCIPASRHCDGVIDCIDDEQSCGKNSAYTFKAGQCKPHLVFKDVNKLLAISFKYHVMV